jgi:hypothetical protein
MAAFEREDGHLICKPAYRKELRTEVGFDNTGILMAIFRREQRQVG